MKYASAHDFRRAFGVRWAARLMPAQLMESMRHELLEFTGESLLGQFDGVLESFTDPGLLLLIDLRVQAHEVRRRLDGRIAHFQIKEAVKR